MKAFKFTIFIIFVLNLFYFKPCFSTHLAGGDMTWQCVGQDSFIISLNLYRDCNGINLGSATITFKCKSTGSTITTKTVTLPTLTDITPVCNSSCTRCVSSSCTFPYGVQRFTYNTGIVTLNGAGSCCEILMIYQGSSRINSISTGLAGTSFYCEAMLNRCLTPCDNSPVFLSTPTIFVRVGKEAIISNTCVDNDIKPTGGLFDSLKYELIPPRNSAGVALQYSSPYSYDKPIYFSGFPNSNLALPQGFHLNENTGELRFRPMLVQFTVIALKVKEYRNGVLIGEIMRDIIIVAVMSNNNYAPIISGSNNQIEICSDDTLVFQKYSIDYNSNDTVRIFCDHNLPSATWTSNNGTVKAPSLTLTWSPSSIHAGPIPYTIILSSKDDACTPIPGETKKIFSVLVKPVNTQSIVTVADSGCGKYQFTAKAKSGFNPQYIWSGSGGISSNSSSFSHRFSQTGVYPFSLTTIDSIACNNDTAVYYDTIVIDTLFTGNIPNDTDVCYGTSMILSANYSSNKGPVSFQWSTGANDTLQTDSIMVDLEKIISIMMSDTMGCIVNDTMEINMHNLPIPGTPDYEWICNYDSTVIKSQVIFDESQMDSIFWYEINDTTFQINVDSIIVSDSGIYICKVIDTLGCVGFDTTVVLENPDIIAYALDSTICAYDTLLLEAMVTGGNSTQYYWYKDSALFSINRLVNVAPLITTDYSLIAFETSNGTQCSDTTIVHVEVNSLPGIWLGNDTTVCREYLLDAGNGYSSYLWTDSSQSSTLNIDTNGTYWVEITDSNNCANRDSINVIIYSLPLVDLGQDTTVCEKYELDAGSNFTSYLWSDSSALQNLIITSTGTYHVTLIDLNGCTNSDTIFVNIDPLPIVNLGNDTTVCDGLTLDAGGGFNSYLWSDSSNLRMLYVNTSDIYWAKVIDTNGCINRDTINITVNSLPYVNLGSDTTVCGSYELDAGFGFVSYLWSDNSITQKIVTYNSGAYWVQITDTNMCTNSDTINLIINPLPLIDFGKDTFMCPNFSLTLSADSGMTSYLWSTGDTIRTITYIYHNVTDTIIWVRQTDSNSCIGFDTILISKDNDCIWPGDANNDGVVNNMDLLPIGLGYNSTGSMRPNASLVWIGQHAVNWNDTLSNGADFKHIDTDGDGTINNSDTLAISLNYGKTRADVNDNSRDTDPPLYFDMSGSYSSGQIVSWPLKLGTSSITVTDFYGLAFTALFPDHLVEKNSVVVDFESSWLGNVSVDLLSFQRGFENSIDIAATRIDHQNISGDGKIGTIYFLLKDSLNDNEKFIISFQDVLAISSNESIIPIYTKADTTIINNTNSIKNPTAGNLDDLVFIYPNPANSIVNFIIDKSLSVSKIRFVNQLGKVCYYLNEIQENVFSIGIDFLKTGIYFIEINTNNGRLIKKLVIVR